MKVSHTELLGKDRSVLTYLLLSLGNTYPEQFQSIVDSVHSQENEDKSINIEISFNGIPIDSEAFSKYLEKEYEQLAQKLAKEYSDIESLAIEKADEKFRKYLFETKKPILDRIEKVREKVDSIYLTLECE